MSVGREVRAWAIENGSNPRMRIAYCGYDAEGTDLLAAGWAEYAWRAGGGYGNQAGNENKNRERVWFSPHCLPAVQGSLFGE